MSDNLRCVATYNVQVVRPTTRTPEDFRHRWDSADKRVLSNLPAMLEAVEEDLTQLLPPGYSAVIREWSSHE